MCKHTEPSPVLYTKVNWLGNTQLQKFVYGYDANGNIIKQTNQTDGSEISYTYDTNGQLTQAIHKSGRTESYTYDAYGNITSFNNGTKSHTYTYGDSQWKDLLTKVDGKTITYDDSGNPLSYYDGYLYTFTWTEGRNLASSTYGGKTTGYSYNASGLRTEKWNSSGRTAYHIAEGTYLGETRYDSSGNVILWMRYNYDESGSIAGISLWYNGVSQSWTNYYFVKNLQGDVLRVYQSNGTLVASYSYDSWGNILTSNGDLKDINPFRYRGYYFDNETWFYYLQSRYYDPAIGRFINADAFASTGQGIIGHNMFAYCGNNPVSYSDSAGTARTYNVNLTDSGERTLMWKAKYEYHTQDKYLSVPENRLEMMELVIDYANEVSLALNVSVEIEIVNYTLCTGTYGEYVYDDNTIKINDAFLYNDPTGGFQELLQTVRHELYHAFQYAAVNAMRNGDPVPNILPCVLNAWADNIDNYIKPSDDFEAYRAQKLEVDARGFALE